MAAARGCLAALRPIACQNLCETIGGSLQTAVSRFSALCACGGGLTSSWTCTTGQTLGPSFPQASSWSPKRTPFSSFIYGRAPPSSCWHRPPAWVWKSQAASGRGTEDEQDVLPLLPVNKQLRSVVSFYIQTGLKTLLDTHLPNCHFFLR